MVENDFSINDAPTMRPVPAPGVGRRFAAGDMILGRYAVTRELGEGGMGVVYQCLDTVGGVEVAVKGLPPDVSRNEDEMDDIRANYQIVRRLRHPNIAGVATLEMDPATGDYYLVMDLAAGTTLKRWARRHADAGIDAKLAILRQVAAALDYAHAEKVIHRDVKPENVMVDDEGVVKVLDFGLAAQIRSSQSRTSAAVTSRGGTPGYKSPEQWRGKPQREPSDVYSFGVMAYWMFAGVLPFDGDDPVVLGHAVLTEPVEQIAGLPEHINAALVKALAKKPEDRFASCGEVVDALEGKNVHVKRVDGVDRAGSPSAPMVRLRVPRARVGVPPLQSGDNSDRKDRKGGVGKVLAVFALLAALAGGGYYGWTKYGEGVKAREAEERARRAKAAEERIARIKAENEKAEAEKRRVEAEREKRQEEAKRKIAAEREKDRKIRDLSAVEDEIEDCKGRINGILKGNFKANGSLKGDWLGFDASKITMIDATVSVREEVPWKRIAKDLTVEDSVVTIENAIVAAQKESKRLKERLENITRIKGIYDAKELESRKEQCRSCGGSKRVACMRCKGDGRVKVPGDDCSACDGRGVISKPRQCDACGGSGNASVKRRCSSCQGKKVRCSSCRGRGFYDITGSLRRPRCGACNGRGYYLCNSCGGRGTEVETVSCKKCSGLGTLDITMRCSRCAGAGKEQREQTCPSCDGTGKSTCESCGGRGFIYRPKGEAESQIRKKEGIRTSSQLQSSVQPVAVGSVIVKDR